MAITILDSLTDAQVVGLTILGEARGEPLEGLIAVAQVIGHRVRDPRWPATWRGVCLQPRQFSCWNDDDPNRPLLLALAEDIAAGRPLPGLRNRQWLEANWVVLGVMQGVVRDLVRGSCHYHAEGVDPFWARGKTAALSLGGHAFFNDVA